MILIWINVPSGWRLLAKRPWFVVLGMAVDVSELQDCKEEPQSEKQRDD